MVVEHQSIPGLNPQIDLVDVAIVDFILRKYDEETQAEIMNLITKTRDIEPTIRLLQGVSKIILDIHKAIDGEAGQKGDG